MSSTKYKERVRQALQAMPRMTADEFYSQMSRSMGTPLKYIKMTNYPTTIGFRSKTEAIERLCLQVFGATPVYGTDVEDFKSETSEEMTKLETELNKAREQLVAESELAKRLEEENANTYLRRWAKAQERAINAERERDELIKQLATERALADRLGDALNQCKDGYEELLEDRAWWAEEPRCGYQKRYLEMVKNKEQTNKALAAWKEARDE